MSGVIHFERIGREHDLAPLDVSGSPDDIAEQVYRFARKHLASGFFAVSVDMASGVVWIEGGRFGKGQLTEAAS